MRNHLTLILAICLVASAAWAQTGSVNTSGTGTSGVYIQSDSDAYPDVSVETRDSFRVFNMTNGSLLRVTEDGWLGLGIENPTGNIHIHRTGGVAGFENLYVMERTGGPPGMLFLDTANNHGWQFRMTSGGNFRITDTNGAGTDDGTVEMDVQTDGWLKVSGNITAGGVISGSNVIANYQDLAEWVPTKAELEPGTVVVIDSTAPNHVEASSHSYDTSVAGVISERPGLLLGEGGEGKTMVATTGRVRIKVDATDHPIHYGDILVTSDKPGVAMKSIPVEVAGIQMHRPGTVVGKALEELAEGEGEILVLLSLQ